MFDKAATPIANKATSPAPEPPVQQKRPRGRPRSNPNDPKWLNAPTPVARPATAKRGIPKDDDDAFKPTEYFKKKTEERTPAEPRKSKRARTLVYESLDQEVIMAKVFPEDPERLDNGRARATQEPTPPTSGESSPKDSIVVPAEILSGGHHHHNNNTNNNNEERFGRGYRASCLPTPPDTPPNTPPDNDDDNKNGRMGPPPPPRRRSGLLSPSPDSPPSPARVPSSVPAAPVPVARVPVAPAPAARVPAAPVPVARVPVARVPVAPPPVAPAPAAPVAAPIAAAPAAPAAPALAPIQVPALDGLDHLNPLDPLGVDVGPGPADFPFDVDAAMALYLHPFHLPPAYVNQWDAWRQPGPFNAQAWQQPERHFFREAIAAHPRGGMCAACMARYGNGFDVLEELFPAFGQQPCCWACPACPGNQFMGAQ